MVFTLYLLQQGILNCRGSHNGQGPCGSPAESCTAQLCVQVGARTENINIRHFLTGNPMTVTVVDPAIRGSCEVAHIGGTHNAIYRQIPSGLEDFLETGFDCVLALGLDCW